MKPQPGETFLIIICKTEPTPVSQLSKRKKFAYKLASLPEIKVMPYYEWAASAVKQT